MNRSLIGAGVTFLALFAGITAVKRLRSGEVGPGAGTASGSKEAILAFWRHYNTATEARGRGYFRAAVESYEKALELNPAHEDSIFYVAVCLQESGRYEAAAARLRRLIELNPESNRAYSQLGTLLATLAPGAVPDFAAAAAAFARNAEINREESGPFARRGLLELNRGNVEAARKTLSIAAGGGAPEALFLSGLLEYLEGRYEEAGPTFLRVLEANAREKAVSGRGVFSEGDVKSGAGTLTMNAFEKAGVKALLFLYWTARRMGGYPPDVPARFRFHPEAHPATERSIFTLENLPGDVSARGVFVDVDRDGRSEILVLGPTRVRLLRFSSGRWEDVTESSGLAGAEGAWDATILDVQGDDWPDVYFVRPGYIGTASNTLYLNERGRFRVGTPPEIASRRATARALAADFNQDGRVDLLEVGNASSSSWRGASSPARNGAPPPLRMGSGLSGGGAIRLFLNEGSRWVEAAFSLGLSYEASAVDAAVSDFDGDGDTDVFVLGWKSSGRLFQRTGTGFADATTASGLENLGGDGLSVLAFDYDRDRRTDLLVSAQAPVEISLRRVLDDSVPSARGTPRLFRNVGQGRFEEVTQSVALDRAFGVMQVTTGDFDRDGWPDLLFAHGGLERERIEPSLILRNEAGKKFVPWAYIPSFDEPRNSKGAAVFDVDGNGWPDVYLAGAGLLKHRGK